MKIFIFILALALAAPVFGADAKNDGAQTSAQSEKEKVQDKAAEKEGEKKAAEKDGKTMEEAPGEYACPYFTVKLPDGWKAILPPKEQQGVVNAIFAKNNNSPAISILVGKNGGADAKTIAGMFAEQFKAAKDPVEKNGAYTFQYPQHDGLTADVTVTSHDKNFMVVTITGNAREARQFLRDNVQSEEYKDLLPGK